MKRRENEHKMNKFRSHLYFKEIDCYSTKEEARINEQIFIEGYKTLNRNKENPINNQINGVNPNSTFYRDKVVPYRRSLYYIETYVGGNEWD